MCVLPWRVLCLLAVSPILNPSAVAPFACCKMSEGVSCVEETQRGAEWLAEERRRRERDEENMDSRGTLTMLNPARAIDEAIGRASLVTPSACSKLLWPPPPSPSPL